MKKVITGIVVIGTCIMIAKLQASIFDDIGDFFKDAWGEVVETGEKVVRTTRYIGHFVINGVSIAIETIKGNPIDLTNLVYTESQTVFYKELPDSVPYFIGLELGSHNSYASLEDGWLLFDQVWNIPNQLQRGVRHLLLDFHYYKDDLLLCHGDCSISTFLKPGAVFMSGLQVFRQIKNFLDKNPKAIVSIDIENFASIDAVLSIMKHAGILHYLLTPQMVNGKTQPLLTKNPDYIYWPTYGHLRSWNKRLIVFDDTENRPAGSAQYVFSTKKTLIRNQYGTLEIDQASEPRDPTDRETDEFQIERLLQLNYFLTASPGLFSYFSDQHNSEANIMGVFSKMVQKKIINRFRPIKYVVLEYVNQNINEIMSMINKLNDSLIKEYAVTRY